MKKKIIVNLTLIYLTFLFAILETVLQKGLIHDGFRTINTLSISFFRWIYFKSDMGTGFYFLDHILLSLLVILDTYYLVEYLFKKKK